MSLDTILQDLRYAARQLRQSPGFATVAVLSLALGIGANTAIFQLVDVVRLRSLPVKHPQELVYVDFPPNSARSGWFSTRSARFTYALWEPLRDQQQAFSGIFAWSATQFNLSPGGEERYAEGLFVSGSFFPTLGVQAIAGRTFAAEDDKPGCGSPGAVISYAFWQRELGGDAAAIGRNLSLNGKSFPIIGITPPSFFGVEVGQRYDVALPICADSLFKGNDGRSRAEIRHAWWLSVMGRLKPGWNATSATSHLQSLAPGIMQASLPEVYRPDQAKRYLANKLIATDGSTGVSGLRRQYETPLWLLLATTGLVLLIACANLANLLLARATVREREMAVRLAIGASRPRLIGQLLMESLLLSFVGALLGAALAQVLSRGLVAFLTTANNPLFVGVGLDLRVLGFTAALAIATCLLFGLLPAWRATRLAPASVLRGGGRGVTSTRERFGFRRALVVTQVALSLVLLTGALLFVRSLQNLLSVDPGFRAEGIVAVSLDLQRPAYPRERLPQLHRDMLERVRSLPGVTSAAQVAMMPISGSGWNDRARPDGTSREGKNANFNRIGPGYFQTMGTPLIAGRDFDDRDSFTAPKVALVNEEFVKQIFDGKSPLGRSFRVDGQAGKPDPVYQVVGIVRNTKYYQLREDFIPIAFVPMAQDDNPGPRSQLVIRSAAPMSGLFAGVKSVVSSINPQIGIRFRILSLQIEESLMRDRLMAMLSGAFGLLAGFLATLGLYGVIAYMVERRRNEIGVRMALGADRSNVIRLILREAAVLLAVGLIAGTGLALWSGKAAGALLFGLKPNDPITLGGAAALLACVAIAASYWPARRASRLDPMVALREE